MIEYRVGDLFAQLPEGKFVLIPHIVNNLGGWGAGFVVPLGKYFPKAKEAYHNWDKMKLGLTQVVKVAESRVVFNMCAQDGYKSSENPVPVKYLALAQCLEKVNNLARVDDTIEIHAPAFGSDLGGGDWRVIAALIQQAIPNHKVCIYTLTQEQQDRLLSALP